HADDARPHRQAKGGPRRVPENLVIAIAQEPAASSKAEAAGTQLAPDTTRSRTARPAAPDFAISRATCITVRQASVSSPWRDMASAMWRVTTGATSLAAMAA